MVVLKENDVLIGRFKKSDRLDIPALQLQNVLTERANLLASINKLVKENNSLLREVESLRAKVFIQEDSSIPKVELDIYA